MSGFDHPFWNLGQAAVWVEFRERRLVDEFADADKETYKALHWYPKMWPRERKKFGQLSALYEALLDGRLEASGFHKGARETRSRIPRNDWVDMYLEPPFAVDRRPEFRCQQPWQEVRVKRTDVTRLWPGPEAIKALELYDWAEIESWYHEFMAKKPDASQNRAIREIQSIHEKKQNGRKGPSRTALQKRIKGWK